MTEDLQEFLDKTPFEDIEWDEKRNTVDYYRGGEMVDTLMLGENKVLGRLYLLENMLFRYLRDFCGDDMYFVGLGDLCSIMGKDSLEEGFEYWKGQIEEHGEYIPRGLPTFLRFFYMFYVRQGEKK